MIEDFKNLTVQGGFFENETSLDFFKNKRDRVSIIYGRNGSGKSSISKAFREYKGNKQINVIPGAVNNERSELVEEKLSTYTKIELKDFENNVMNFPVNNENDCIHVFDDTYISDNIRFAKDGLKSIVMFGDQIDIDDKLVEMKKQIGNKNEELEKKNKDFEKYSIKKGFENPETYFNSINDTLKSKDGWAFRDSQIRRNTNKTPVRSNLISELGEMKLSETKNEIEIRLMETQEKYNKVNNNNNKIETIILPITLAPDESLIKKLLISKIKKPKVTEREKEILVTIEGDHAERISELKSVCNDKNAKICPFCYQPISEEYKQELMINIKHILNRDADNHKNELRNIELNKLDFQLDEFIIVDQKLVDSLNSSCIEYNQKIDIYKTSIELKITKIYSSVFVPYQGINETLNTINEKIKKLNIKKNEYNENIEKKDLILSSLLNLNKQLAHFEISNDYNQYLKRTEFKNNDESEMETLKAKITELKLVETDLKNQKINIKLAVKKINKGLKYIFFKEDRMSVEINNDLYYIKTFGRDVNVKDISVGERNVLALCYFFCQILDQCDEGDEYSKRMLVIIDDPISSFDFENKVGMHSYLHYQMKKLLKGNDSSKIIIQSHELCAVSDFDTAIFEILPSLKKKQCDENYKKNVFELDNKQLKKIDINNYNEYTRLLNDIYHFASKKSDYDKYDLVIGNEMRRVLEAYSTFEYRSGIVGLSTDTSILKKLGGKKYEEYFENLMYRLVLNGESHTKLTIQSLSSESLFEFISTSEKIRTARDLLVFLYILNKEHVIKHLVAYTEAKDNIEHWKSKI